MTTTTPPGRDAAPNLSSYEEARASFRLDVPARFNPVLDIVERWAREDPAALALLSVDGSGAEPARHSVRAIAR